MAYTGFADPMYHSPTCDGDTAELLDLNHPNHDSMRHGPSQALQSHSSPAVPCLVIIVDRSAKFRVPRRECLHHRPRSVRGAHSPRSKQANPVCIALLSRGFRSIRSGRRAEPEMQPRIRSAIQSDRVQSNQCLHHYHHGAVPDSPRPA